MYICIYVYMYVCIYLHITIREEESRNPGIWGRNKGRHEERGEKKGDGGKLSKFLN